MKVFTKITSLVLLLLNVAGGSAFAEETSPVDGLSVGATGIVGNHGAGGGVTADFQRDHYRLNLSAGALGAFDGTGEVRPIGSLGGIYCFRESFGMGLCLGAPNLVQADGNLTQFAVSGVGLGYVSGDGGSFFIGPRYSYILFDNENNTHAHMLGAEMNVHIPIGDSLRAVAMFQIGATFGSESHDASLPLVEDGAGLYLQGGFGLDWTIADRLRMGIGATVTDAFTGERLPEDTAGSRFNVTGQTTVQWAF